MNVNAERLYASLAELGQIGAYPDPDSGLAGVRRLALTAADGEGRRHVVAQMKAAGLEISVDQIGNVYGLRRGRDDQAKPVMAGSHIDSVATAGRFDGCLGVLGALEVVRTLNDHKQVTRRPLVVAFFTEEEGCRFGTDMLGSAVATGRVPLERAWGLKDAAGLTVRAELEAIGFLGAQGVALAAPHAYVECHIEQGPTLKAAGQQLGVVSGVQAICWHELVLHGKSAHAGTTPMSLRADPGVAASRINVKLRELVSSGRYGPELRATMGQLKFEPGLVNVVPNKVTCTVDVRNPDEAILARALEELLGFYRQVAAEEKITLTHRETARTPPVAFALKVRQLVASAAARRGLTHRELVSGAGHDCQELARLCPAGMIFVPGEADGISHNPRELSTSEQCANGVNVLLDVLTALAEEEGP